MKSKILIGSNIDNPLYVFNTSEIVSCETVLSSSLSGDELAIDQFMPVVYSASYIRVKYVPLDSASYRTADGKIYMVYPGTGFLDKLPYSTPVWYYNDDNLIGKFYSQRIVRSGKTYFDVLAVSAIGIMEGQQHYGGIYTGETFEAVAREIIDGSFYFSCAEDVASIPVYGWLPIGTKRDNLHQLLFACGVGLYKDESGEVLFRFPDTDRVTNVPDSRIYVGGSVDYMTPATRVEVTEHIYETLPDDEIVTLYDNTQGAETAVDTFVSFSDAPIHDLETTGNLTISESGVNYAVVSGVGTLTGKKYTHITRVVQRSGNSEGEDKLVSVTEATLVNVANSENVARRVYSYYSSVRTIQADIVLNGERPGDQISFNNSFEEPEQAFISGMDINASSFLKGSCELITGYLPSGGGNNYTRIITLTGSGRWIVPDDIPVDENGKGKIRVAVIQAGWGAEGGHCGSDGGENSFYYNELAGMNPDVEYFIENSKEVGIGGAPGEPGKPGKVFVATLTVVPGQEFSFDSGSGGIGGAGETKETPAQPGTEGGETTFGNYSSADGTIIDGGYLDIINNVLYAHVGENGIAGGNGFIGGETDVSPGNGFLSSEPSSGTWNYNYQGNNWPSPFRTGGGGQGGNAYGAQGLIGEKVENTYNEDVSASKTSTHINHGSSGGDGAEPIAPSQAQKIGQGGQGGHGGGGGGTGGSFSLVFAAPYIVVTASSAGGKGANGSKGGDGAPGGIIIYL